MVEKEDPASDTFDFWTESKADSTKPWKRRGGASVPIRKIVTVTAGEYEGATILRGVVQFKDWEYENTYWDAVDMGWGYFDIEIRVVDNQLTKIEVNWDNWTELEDYGWVL